MSNTSNLVLPFLAVGQAQKHVTVNESLRKLDAIVQLSVASATTAAEPGSPEDGSVWILPAGKTGTHWLAFANGALAYYRDGAWVEVVPREGWLAFVRDTEQLLAWSGSAWSLFPAAKLLAVSATDRVLGRSTAGAGAAEEIACTAAGRALIDDADAAAQRATLGLGTAAIHADGDYVHTSGAEDIGGAKKFTSVPALKFDNPFIEFRRTDNTRNGYFQVLNGSSFVFVDEQSAGFLWSSGGAYRLNLTSGGKLLPFADNTQKLGDAANRWSEIYAGNGVINTSDAAEKTAVRPLNDPERRAIRRIVSGAGVFRWRASVEAKGEAARLHVGVTAQSVVDAFAAEGLDAARYGLFCADEIETGEDRVKSVRYGVRYDQLFAMALATLFEG